MLFLAYLADEFDDLLGDVFAEYRVQCLAIFVGELWVVSTATEGIL